MLLLGPLLSLASAAVVTEVPPFLRGDIQVGYTFTQLSGSLIERTEAGDVDVGDRALAEHALGYKLVFSVGPGVAVFAELPHYVSSSVSYGSLREMVYDPTSGSGTYQGTAEGTPGTYLQGSGLGGVWFGVRGTPFSEAFPKRNSHATWLLEGALRTADPTGFWVSEDTSRGAGPGGPGARLHTAFSTTFGSSAPYLSGTIVNEGPTTVSVATFSGATIEDVTINPADHGDIRIGVELVAAENSASGSLFVFDLHLGVAYAGPAELPSGFYLPNVLAVLDGQSVLSAEQLEVGAGLALHWRAFKNFEIGLAGDVGYHMPQRLEYPYAVYTGPETLAVTLGSDIKVRFR